MSCGDTKRMNSNNNYITDMTEKELQEFALDFDGKIIEPLIKAGFGKQNIFDILNINRHELRYNGFWGVFI